MTTVAQIEDAIEHLPLAQVHEVAAWLEEYRATIHASAETLAQLDLDEAAGSQWHDPQ